MIEIRIPIRLVSEANQREHWATKAKRAKLARNVGHLVVRSRLRDGRLALGFPFDVAIVRIAPRALDSDNLHGSAKNLRDGIADALGIKDNDPRVTWWVSQERGKPREYAAIVRIGARA